MNALMDTNLCKVYYLLFTNLPIMYPRLRSYRKKKRKRKAVIMCSFFQGCSIELFSGSPKECSNSIAEFFLLCETENAIDYF